MRPPSGSGRSGPVMPRSSDMLLVWLTSTFG